MGGKREKGGEREAAETGTPSPFLSGTGIDASHLQKVYEPYFANDAAAPPVGGGAAAWGPYSVRSWRVVLDCEQACVCSVPVPKGAGPEISVRGPGVGGVESVGTGL